jgi:hypothetical protein
MKLSLDPLPALRERAEEAINAHFNRLAYDAGQCDAEHAAKRTAARSALDHDLVPDWFNEAAAIEGQEPGAFARSILAKPDEAAERGNARRRAIVAVRAATTVATIDSVLAELGARIATG